MSAHVVASRSSATSPEPTQPVVAVVLAAGAASRFGATKQVAAVDGRPMVARVVDVARAADRVDEVHLVVGHDADAVVAALAGAGVVAGAEDVAGSPDVAVAEDVTVVVNEDHAAGQATSLRAGVRSAAARGASALVVLLADEPDVSSAAVDEVLAAVERGASVARARYDDASGHPVAFAASTFTRLREVTGDRGARDLLAELDVREVRVRGSRPRDVDTPDDLAARDRR
jgi:molybdenum cofactor cytidylyltransferase